MLPKWAFIDSTEDLNTTNVLAPAIAYLSLHNGKFERERDLRQFIHWMYAALSWARYTSQTDQRLDHDISLIVRTESPWQELVNAIISALDAHTAMSTQALNSPDVQRGLKDILLNHAELYERLRRPSEPTAG